MRIIIADGTEVFVDDSDYAELANYVWHIKQRTNYLLYVYRYERCDIPNRISKYRRVKMHQQIMGFPQGKTPDHKNGNPLDNQRSNLRLATQQQQAFNTHRRNGKKHKGVTFCPTVHGKYKCNVPWRARIRIDNKLISLGFFATQEAAAQAYNEAAVRYFGEFAALNVIEVAA